MSNYSSSSTFFLLTGCSCTAGHFYFTFWLPFDLEIDRRSRFWFWCGLKKKMVGVGKGKFKLVLPTVDPNTANCFRMFYICLFYSFVAVAPWNINCSYVSFRSVPSSYCCVTRWTPMCAGKSPPTMCQHLLILPVVEIMSQLIRFLFSMSRGIIYVLVTSDFHHPSWFN